MPFGAKGLRVAYVEGDEVLHLREHFTPFSSHPLPDPQSFFSANAYLGAGPVAAALSQGADIVITGRVADPSLFLAALLHTFGWKQDAWDLLGQGIVIGHLLECAGQLTGGYFADPGFKDVPGIENIGFPLAEICETGAATFMKLDSSGGLPNRQTCREQLLYEAQDPAAYATPDVTADFTSVRIEQQASNRMHVAVGRGRARPADYKVSIGMLEGVIAEGQISYAGPGALNRVRLAQSILQKRMVRYDAHDLRFDIIGLSSVNGLTAHTAADMALPTELRLRAAGRFASDAAANCLVREVESLYLNGPAGGAGVTYSVRENTSIVPALIARDLIRTTITMEEA